MPVKQPQDRQAKAEAVGRDIVVEHDGVTYQIDRGNVDNLELLEFIEDEKYIKAIRGYLGPDQWDKFKDAHRDDKGRVSAATFEDFINVVMAAIGGNSEASPTS